MKRSRKRAGAWQGRIGFVLASAALVVPAQGQEALGFQSAKMPEGFSRKSHTCSAQTPNSSLRRNDSPSSVGGAWPVQAENAEQAQGAVPLRLVEEDLRLEQAHRAVDQLGLRIVDALRPQARAAHAGRERGRVAGGLGAGEVVEGAGRPPQLLELALDGRG